MKNPTKLFRKVYPVTAKMWDDLKPHVQHKAVRVLLETVNEYEHGSADVEDVHPGMTVEAYAAVATDLALCLVSAEPTDET